MNGLGMRGVYSINHATTLGILQTWFVSRKRALYMRLPPERGRIVGWGHCEGLSKASLLYNFLLSETIISGLKTPPSNYLKLLLVATPLQLMAVTSGGSYIWWQLHLVLHLVAATSEGNYIVVAAIFGER